jgi:WD40 repeat protein
MQGHEDWVVSLSFSPPDGKTLATAAAASNVWITSRDHSIRLWDVSSGKEKGTLEGHTKNVTNVVFSPDGKTLASAGRDWTLIFWDVANLKEVGRILGENIYSPNRVVFTPDGKTVVLASFGSEREALRFRDVATGDLRFSLRPHTENIMAVAISRDGRTLATGGWDKTVRLLRAASEQEVKDAGW